jgi:hypothetical protein
VLVMSPMEFRPVTERDIAARTQGGAAPAGRPAAGRPLNYALNPDRAWTPSPEQIRLQVQRLTVRLKELIGRPMQVRVTDCTRTEQFATGMLDAAAWSLGDVPRRPVDSVEARVCDAEIRVLLALVDRIVKAHEGNWAEAAGAGTWLMWLNGTVAEISYPDEWDLDSLAKRA